MTSHIFQAYLRLIHIDYLLARGDFLALYELVRRYPVGKSAPPEAIEPLCRALDLACVWYWKQVLCLQRSAAATCLLKRYGIPARMVIGAQQVPFRSHAWVEVEGRVVNDKPYVRDIYQVLTTC